VDYGLRRVGVAVSDPTGTLARPLGAIRRRRGKRPPVQALADTAAEHGVERIIMGLPLPLEGGENEWCEEVRAVGAALAERTGLPVDFVDERFTSIQAERAVRSSGLKKRDREDKDRIDAGAAALILQSFLDGGPTR